MKRARPAGKRRSWLAWCAIGIALAIVLWDLQPAGDADSVAAEEFRQMYEGPSGDAALSASVFP